MKSRIFLALSLTLSGLNPSNAQNANGQAPYSAPLPVPQAVRMQQSFEHRNGANVRVGWYGGGGLMLGNYAQQLDGTLVTGLMIDAPSGLARDPNGHFQIAPFRSWVGLRLQPSEISSERTASLTAYFQGSLLRLLSTPIVESGGLAIRGTLDLGTGVVAIQQVDHNHAALFSPMAVGGEAQITHHFRVAAALLGGVWARRAISGEHRVIENFTGFTGSAGITIDLPHQRGLGINTEFLFAGGVDRESLAVTLFNRTPQRCGSQDLTGVTLRLSHIRLEALQAGGPTSREFQATLEISEPTRLPDCPQENSNP